MNFHFHFIAHNKITTHTLPQKKIAISIGNFDGLHLGHQTLLRQLNAYAQQHNLLSAVMTFYPHPKYVLGVKNNINDNIVQIDTVRQKIQKILHYVNGIYYIKFTQELAQLSAVEFVQKLYTMQVKYILVGEDFHFAYKRQANINDLIDLALPLGIQVEKYQLINEKNSKKISSTLMRQALQKADFKTYETYTQQKFFYTQKVCKGKQIGRTIGFPTLNLRVEKTATMTMHTHFILPVGVYAVNIIFENDENNTKYNAVASLGYRPTVELNNPRPELLLEVHILNWKGDAYGQRVYVYFLHKIRNEHQYINLETMKEVIQQDIKYAQAYF